MASKILCIIDGATDEKFQISEMLKLMFRGYFLTTPDGYETESNTCIMNLLGVENIPKNSRAWFEAKGNGINLCDNDLVLRTSLVNIKDGIITSLSNRSDEIDLPGYFSLGDYKGIMVLKGRANELSDVTSYPVHKHMGERLPEDLGIEQPLKDEGIYLVPWSPSVKPKIKEWNIEGFAVTGIPLVKGIAKAIGMKSSENQEFTGDVDTNILAKIDMVLDMAEKADFVLLHINGADEAAHRMNEEEKIEFRNKVIEMVNDKLMSSKHQVVVTSDHGTSSISGHHMKIKQPYYTNFDIKFNESEGIREWLKR
ncbi:MAG: alkaline phosphatase family protein [Peptostreptococcaceae bacterium]|nr:alkaline phosphatase family protein [Peptostreptococcaceae bacterium]